MHFSPEALTPSQLAAVRGAIGTDRLAAYDEAVGGDDARAISLYGWNAAISAALFEDLGVLEVTLRNACHRELQAWNATQGNASPWYHHPVLTPGGMEDVGRARRRVVQGGKPETEGRGRGADVRILAPAEQQDLMRRPFGRLACDTRSHYSDRTTDQPSTTAWTRSTPCATESLTTSRSTVTAAMRFSP